MRIVAVCPKCDARLPLEAAERPPAIQCGKCAREIVLRISALVAADEAVDLCPVCAGGDFYARKDFNPQVGLTVIVVGALVSGAFYRFGLDLVAYGILASAVLIDLLMAWRLPEVTVCYRCHSEFRGRYPRTTRAFDLHTADVLELEYERRIGRR